MIGPTDLLHASPAPHFKTFHVFLIYCPNRPSFSTVQTFNLLKPKTYFMYHQL